MLEKFKGWVFNEIKNSSPRVRDANVRSEQNFRRG